MQRALGAIRHIKHNISIEITSRRLCLAIERVTQSPTQSRFYTTFHPRILRLGDQFHGIVQYKCNLRCHSPGNLLYPRPAVGIRYFGAPEQPPSDPSKREETSDKSEKKEPNGSSQNPSKQRSGGYSKSSHDSSLHGWAAKEAKLKDWILSSRYISVVLGSMAVLVITGGVLYYYYHDEIQAYLKSVAVDVTSSTIVDEKTHTSAILLTSKLAEDLLSRLEVISNATEFVKSILNNEQTLAATVDLLVKLANDKRTQAALTDLASTLVSRLSQDPATMDSLAKLLQQVIQRQDSHDVLVKVLSDTLKDPKLQNTALEALMQVVHRMLDDEHLREHAIILLKAVISDSNLQQATGSALWQTVRAAVSTSWFKKHAAAAAQEQLPIQTEKHIEDSTQQETLALAVSQVHNQDHVTDQLTETHIETQDTAPTQDPQPAQPVETDSTSSYSIDHANSELYTQSTLDAAEAQTPDAQVPEVAGQPVVPTLGTTMVHDGYQPVPELPVMHMTPIEAVVGISERELHDKLRDGAALAIADNTLDQITSQAQEAAELQTSDLADAPLERSMQGEEGSILSNHDHDPFSTEVRYTSGPRESNPVEPTSASNEPTNTLTRAERLPSILALMRDPSIISRMNALTSNHVHYRRTSRPTSESQGENEDPYPDQPNVRIEITSHAPSSDSSFSSPWNEM